MAVNMRPYNGAGAFGTQPQQEKISETFDAWADRRKREAALRASTALSYAKQAGSPDAAARRAAAAARVSHATGRDISPDLFSDEEALQQVEAELEFQKTSQILQNDPGTAGWLANYQNAEVASDDVQNLGFWGQNLLNLGNSAWRGADQAADNTRLGLERWQINKTRQMVLDGDRTLQEIFADIRPEETTTGEVTLPDGTTAEFEVQDPAGQSLDMFTAVERWARSRLGTLFRFGDEGADVLAGADEALEDNLGAAEAEQRERQDAWPGSAPAQQMQQKLANLPEAENLWESTTRFWDLAQEDPNAMFQFITGVAAESLPGVLVASAATLATRNPQVGAAVLGGTSFSRSQGNMFLELVQQEGYDLSSEADRLRLIKDPKVLSRLDDQAFTYGMVVGLMDAASAGIATKTLVNNAAGDLMLQMATQAVMGGSGEALGLIASGQAVNWDEVLLEGIAELVTGPIEIAGVAGRATVKRARGAKLAEERRRVFDAISQSAQESKTRQRVPAKYQEFVEQRTQDGPVETLYVDAGKLDELFQSGAMGDVSPQEFFDTVPDLSYAEYQTALESGMDFQIPTAVFATHLVGTRFEAPLTENLRFSPTELSMAEATEVRRQIQEASEQVGQSLQQLEERVAELDAQGQAAYDDLVSQLRVAGRRPEVAAREALPLVKFAQTQARRAGISTEQFLQRYALPIVQAVEPAGTVRSVVSFPDTLKAIADPEQATAPLVTAINEQLADVAADPEMATEDEIREAAIRAAAAGQLPYALADDFFMTPTAIDPRGEELQQTVTLRAGEETLEDWGHTPGQTVRTRELAQILQKRQRKLYGKIRRDQRGAKTVEKMANWMADEIEFELQTPFKSAKGWYTTKYQAALDTLAEVFPEFTEGPEGIDLPGLQRFQTAEEARSFFTALLAITSNGAKVIDNFRMASNAYEVFRETGALPEVRGGGERAQHTNSRFGHLMELVDRFDTVQEMTDFMLSEISVSELNRELRAMGEPPLSSMPASAVMPRSAAILGPKLGAFWANLMGSEGYLTMDLWWTRTINRYRGDMFPKVSGMKDDPVDSKGRPKGLARFKELVQQPHLPDRDALNLATEYAQRYKDKGYKNGTEAEKAANTIYKAAFVNLAEQPEGARDRAFMIEVAKAAREEVQKRTGESYSIADIQALIWYYEKRLYADMGVRQSGDVSYEEAAARAVGLLRDQPGGPGLETAERVLEQGPADTGRSTVREEVTAGDRLRGDGRKFSSFFADVTAGRRQQAQNLDRYAPVIELPAEVTPFTEARERVSGNFDRHIMTSIPGYREMQDAVGYAISQMLGSGKFLRIGASEGSTVKAVIELADEGATGVAMDPNPQMRETFDATDQVDGVTFDLSAFSSAEEEGQVLWTEDDGTEIPGFDPRGEKFDVVVEQMVFQFISNTRGAQVARVKELMAEGGLFYTAEKFGGPADVYRANEEKKDLFKARFYDEQTLEAKRQEVLQTGGDAVEGMTDLQVSTDEMEAILQEQFAHVAQVWDSGNFKGFAASDDKAKLDEFLSLLPDLGSEYATVETPRMLGGEAEYLQGPNPDLRLEDFSTAPEAAFRQDGWFIVTATQDRLGAHDSPENAAAREELRAQLERLKLPFTPVEGMYRGTSDGESYLVLGHRSVGKILGRDFNQESIITKNGLEFTDGSGTADVPFDRVLTGDEARDNGFYSVLPDGTTVSLDLVFPPDPTELPAAGEELAPGIPLREDGKLEIVHWSSQPRDRLDPAYAGTGDLRGPERRRSGPKKVYGGLAVGRPGGYKKENSVLGAWKHTLAVDPDRLYDWYRDPDGLKAQLDRDKPSIQLVGDYEQLIKDAGYLGYFVTEGPLGATAALFEAVEPESVEQDLELHQSWNPEPIYKSALAEQVLEAKQKTATAKDWLAILPKLPGVKKAEIEWTGVDTWLEGKDPKEQVSRDDVYRYISDSTMEVLVEEDEDRRFASYTAAGGSNYREVLVRVPDLHRTGRNRGTTARPFVNASHFSQPNVVVHMRLTDRQVDGRKVLFVEEVQSDLASEVRKNPDQVALPGDTAQEDALRARIAELNAIQTSLTAEVATAATEAYKAARDWVADGLGEEAQMVSEAAASALATNIKAALRYPDEAGADADAVRDSLGRRFIASARAAASTLKLRGELRDSASAYDAVKARFSEVQDRVLPRWEAYFDTTRAAIAAEQERSEANAELGRLARQRDGGSLPDTPFVDEAYVQLAAKAALRMAADGGYDAVSWTPGYIQQERYYGQQEEAAGRIDEVRVRGWSVEDNTVGVGMHIRIGEGVDADGDQVSSALLITNRETGIVETVLAGDNRPWEQAFQGQPLSGILPGNLAERALSYDPTLEEPLVMSGQDARVGAEPRVAEGYKNVYDRQLRKFLDKWSKKLGGKVEVREGVLDRAAQMERSQILNELDALQDATTGEEAYQQLLGAAPNDEVRQALEQARPELERFLLEQEEKALARARAELAEDPPENLSPALVRSNAEMLRQRVARHENNLRVAQEYGALRLARPRKVWISLTSGPIEEQFGAQVAEDMLRALLPASSRGADKSTWFLPITSEMRNAAARAQPLYQRSGDAPRGSIILPPDTGGRPTLKLFEGADLSTVLHESAHYFLWVLQDMAKRNEGQMAEDWSVLLTWWHDNADAVAADGGVEPEQVRQFLSEGTTGDRAIDQKINVGLHEQFARGFEAYALEGKAPSQGLRAAFESFAAWLLSIYRDIRGLNVQITDEVRAVFDRMLATDEELAAVRAENNIDDMVADTAREMGLDEESYQRLVDLSREAREEARQLALKDTMAPIRRAYADAYRKEREEVRAEVTAEVNAKRYNRVREWLGNARWLGDDVPEQLPDLDLRMDTDLLRDEFGEEILQRLPRGRRPLFKQGTGLSADDVAPFFGYASGAQMLEDLATAPDPKTEIKSRVEAEMRQRDNGDPLADGTVEQVALDALHGDKRGQVIAAELRAINRLGAKQKTTTRAQARAIAQAMIDRMPAREALRTQRFLAAERRQAEQASRLLAEGRLEEAFDAKRKQLIQHALYSEARKADELVGKLERLTGRLRKKSTRENLAGEYLAAIDEILDTYDFRRTSGRADQRRGSLKAYIDMMIAAGRENELAIPQHVQEQAQRKPYKTLPMRHLRGVYDSLRNIEHTARFKQKLRDAQAEREMQDIRDDIREAFAENVDGKPLNRVETSGDRARGLVGSYFNSIKNADTLLRMLDGWRDGGAVYRHLKDGIDRASTRAEEMRREAAERFDDLYSVYTPAERRAMSVRRTWEGSDEALSKWDLISIALNTGNKDNFERLTSADSRGSFGEDEVAKLLENLDERDWKFVQATWDLIDSYWPMIKEREERVTGVAPEKVEPLMQVDIPGMPRGIRGGYYPIKYDRRFSAKTEEDRQRELQVNVQAGRFGKAQTRNGHTKERASGSGGRTVELGMPVLHSHINQVVHDLAFSEEVNNVWKILQDNQVKGLFEESGMLDAHQQLEIWIQDVAAGQIGGGDWLSRMARRAKNGFTLSKLAFNMSTVAIQVTGLAQTAAFVGKRNTAKAIIEYVAGNPWSTARRVKESSPFMAERETTFNRDIYDLLGEVTAGPIEGRMTQFRDYLARWGFYAMQKVQFYAVDMPTWLAGYESGIRQGMTEEQARRHADRVVARAQASGFYADRTAIERGSIGRNTRQNDFLRLFTTLGSYMFAKFNVAAEVAGRTRRDVTGVNAKSFYAIANGVMDMALLFVLEALLYNAIKGTLPGFDDDDEDEQTWAEFIASETALSALSTLPFIRDGASFLKGYGGGGAYAGVLETAMQPFLSAQKVFDEDAELTFSDFRGALDAVGLAVPGIPSTAIARVVEAAVEEATLTEYIMGVNR